MPALTLHCALEKCTSYQFPVLFLFCFICHFYPPFTRKRIVSLYVVVAGLW